MPRRLRAPWGALKPLPWGCAPLINEKLKIPFSPNFWSRHRILNCELKQLLEVIAKYYESLATDIRTGHDCRRAADPGRC